VKGLLGVASGKVRGVEAARERQSVQHSRYLFCKDLTELLNPTNPDGRPILALPR
jgi:hypothetical protein